MTVDRYIAGEVIRPFLLIVAVLLSIYVAISLASLLNNVWAGKLSLSVVAWLILLRTVIVLEVLLPSALYMGLFVGLRRMHQDSEMVAFWAGGVSNGRLLRTPFLLALLVAAGVLALSVVGRPWAYQTSYAVEEGASLQAGLEKLRAKAFNALDDGRVMLYFAAYDKASGKATEVFVRQKKAHSQIAVRAREMRIRRKANRLYLNFKHGFAYELGEADKADQIVRFAHLDMILAPDPVSAVRNKRKALATSVLAFSRQPKEVAEFQWRLALPLLTVLLAIVAMLLARTPPRSAGGKKLILAIIFYVGLFYWVSVQRTALERGGIDSFPGLWVVPLSGFVLLAAFFIWTQRWRAWL